jgi:hypothetical protein
MRDNDIRTPLITELLSVHRHYKDTLIVVSTVPERGLQPPQLSPVSDSNASTYQVLTEARQAGADAIIRCC